MAQHTPYSHTRQRHLSTRSPGLRSTQWWFTTGLVVAAIVGSMLSEGQTRAGEPANQNEQGWGEVLDRQHRQTASMSDGAEQPISHQANQSTQQADRLEEERIVPVRIHSVATADQPFESTDSFAVIGDIYTDNDRTEYGSEIAVVLDQVKQIMGYAQHSTIQLEAHCDDRQTSAYSLIIGEQRARSLAASLEMTEVDGKRIQVVSYGREQPSCRQWTINCWEDNLRMQQIFRTLASNEPHDGCFVRINIQDSDEMVTYLRTTTASAFLKKIHLAEPTSLLAKKRPHLLTH